ncbi:uncharacterized protein LOC113574403 isoform X2 [Electrophorus electricus]|uniref:uncharacterized protein LOC113574403 isoform X2 n=1 Tax=Electrophorus electricus TaxID=8005 RepID=UPI0015D06FF9|nr:uncharacterized protein LOC113574403 isoform X2 [Electrophorus electricus]
MKLCRDMEFTRLNTASENDNAVLNYEKEVETESQHHQPESHSLPRTHFLHSGYFHSATESSAFSPYTKDHKSKYRELQDQCSSHSGKYGCIAQSSSPPPLAQPGFYSPKIPRSKHCEPSLFSAKPLKVCSPTENITHTLPLSNSKIAVLKQRLCCKPQRIKTTLVEKPCLMKAVISETTELKQLGQQQHSRQFQCIKDIQNQCFSSPHQSSLNLPSTPVSRRMEYVWNHFCPPQSNKDQLTQRQNIRSLSSMQKCDQDLPKIQPSLDQPNRYLQSSSNNKCSPCNCIPNSLDSSDYLQSSQSHGSITHGNRNLDMDKEMFHSKVRKHSSDVRNNSSSKRNKRTLLFCSQVDITSKNVFGQPRVVASLRPSCSPQPIHRSTIVEDLKKLIVMDDTTDNSQDDPTSLQQTKTPGSPSQLQKHDSASPSPLMLASHVLSKQPLCRPSNLYLQSGPRVCQSISGLVESEVWDMDLQFDHGLLPVLNTAHGLDRNHLVKAAEVYEMQREANLLYVEPHTMHSGLSPVTCSPSYSCQNIPDDSLPVSGDTELLLGCFEDNFVEFPDPLSHLEMTLRKLSSDLVKEKKNKVALMAEVLKLRMSNQHLKEESLSANAQLQKIYQMFNDSKQNNV